MNKSVQRTGLFNYNSRTKQLLTVTKSIKEELKILIKKVKIFRFFFKGVIFFKFI